MRVYKLLVAIVLLLFVNGVSTVAQQESGAKMYSPVLTGAPVLSITPDARSAGMGEVGLTTSADAHSIYHNVSKLAFVDKRWGVSFGYTPWLSEVSRDISLSTLSGYYKFEGNGSVDHALGASVRYFHIGQALAFQRQTLLPMAIVPYELTFDVGYSIALGEHWALGASLRYLRSDYNYSVSEYKALVNNFLMDLSATYQTSFELGDQRSALLRSAIALNNVGGKMSYDNGRSFLFAPATLRLGVGCDFEVGHDHQLGVHVEAKKVLAPTRKLYDIDNPDKYNEMNMWTAMGSSFNDADGGASEEFQEVLWAVGLEYVYDKRFFLRGGYHYQHPLKGVNKGLTMGLGFIYEWATLDLSYFSASQSNSPLNNTLRITLGINF